MFRPQHYLIKGTPVCFVRKTQVEKKCECCYLSNSSIHTLSQLEFSEYFGKEAKGHALSHSYNDVPADFSHQENEQARKQIE